MSTKMMTEEQREKYRAYQREYHKKWRVKNKDKAAQHQITYWKKKEKAMKAARKARAEG